jgi:hypothetical protein
VQTLGITGALQRTLRTTNPIENLNGSVAHYCPGSTLSRPVFPFKAIFLTV